MLNYVNISYDFHMYMKEMYMNCDTFLYQVLVTLCKINVEICLYGASNMCVI